MFTCTLNVDSSHLHNSKYENKQNTTAVYVSPLMISTWSWDLVVTTY